jgi:hypothetical protein
MMIRAHVRGVAEVDIGFYPLRQSPDPRVFLLEPLLHRKRFSAPTLSYAS